MTIEQKENVALAIAIAGVALQILAVLMLLSWARIKPWS
jgi:hypothetical protein